MSSPKDTSDTKEDFTEGQSPRMQWLVRNRGVLIAIGTWAVFAAIAFVTYRITGDVRYDDVLDALDNTSWHDILVAALLTAVSFALLTGYDVNALRHQGKSLNYGQVALIAFSAYAIGNTAGFGPLSGGAVRYRGYSRLGLKGEEIAGVIAFVTLFFGLGLAVTTGMALLVFADQITGAFDVPALWLRLMALAGLAALAGAAFFLWRTNGRLRQYMPRMDVALSQLVLSAADIAVCATVLYVLLPADVQISWTSFVAIYAIAIGLGVLSHVPAGLGVFEAVILATIGRLGPTDAILGSLFLYRLIYHVLPLLVAVALVVWTEALQALHSPSFQWAQRMGGFLAPPLVATLSLICGVMLIFSSVIPTPQDDLLWLADYIPIQMLEAAHFLSSLLGLGLVLTARGLTQRLDGAFWLTLGAASAAFVFTFIKAIAPYEAVMLAVLIGALLMSRPLFDRPASLLAQALTPIWIAAIAMIAVSAAAILLFVYKDVEYSRSLWWQFEFEAEAPRGLRALLGFVIAASAIALFSLLRPARQSPALPTEAELQEALTIVQAQNNGDANLIRMRDKSLIFSEKRDAFLMYAVQGRSWISLFGPIGAEMAQAELIWRFAEMARTAGGRPVLYQAPPEILPLCADAGLRGLKLGERALVDLVAMDIQTSRWAEQRQSLRRGERDGLSFEVVPPEAAHLVMDDLQLVSDAWLAHHDAREKGFALGRFDRDYVAEQPIALLRMAGHIVAFATIMLTATKEEATVDLMRFARNAPRGAMDFLFCSLLVEMKRQGYRYFNLGMAPLSGITAGKAAPFWNHVGQSVFDHGERFYNFRGLRSFKSKYHPSWQSRYLVTPGSASPIAALFDVTLLIGGGFRGVIGK